MSWLNTQPAGSTAISTGSGPEPPPSCQGLPGGAVTALGCVTRPHVTAGATDDAQGQGLLVGLIWSLGVGYHRDASGRHPPCTCPGTALDTPQWEPGWRAVWAGTPSVSRHGHPRTAPGTTELVRGCSMTDGEG